MNNRKNYNSIVFLTTLSVYLGLVLVGGATPSVLGQAATTRNFDIKSEIVVEDDLDKKPDEGLFEDLVFFESDDLPSYLGSGRFDKTGIEIRRKLFKKKSEFGLRAFYSGYPETINFKFSVENKGFNIETQINLKTNETAQSFADLIYTYLSQTESSAKNNNTKIVAENTKSKAHGTKILLVTHLPRASIDALLARKDAQ